MKNICKKIQILALVALICIVNNTKAYAAHKLDFFAQAEEVGKQVETYKTDMEEEYNAAMSDLKGKVMAATGLEGSALFNMLMTELGDVGKDFVKNMGNQLKNGEFDVGAAFNDSARDYANLSLSAATAENLFKDYAQTLEAERTKQLAEINKALEEINKEIEQAAGDEEKTAELMTRKDELEKTKIEIERKASARDKRKEELKINADIAKRKANEVQSYMDSIKVEQVLDLFGEKSEDGESIEEKEKAERLDEMYGANIDEFFLGKYEVLNSETMARVRANRQKEYYRSLQNLMRVIMIGAYKGQSIADKRDALLDKTTEADGIFGGNAMKIGVDIQKAKIAARYTELLLAEIRFNSVAEMNSWTDKYRNNKKDVTKFNLDDYVYKKKSAVQKLWDKAMDKGQDALRKNLDSSSVSDKVNSGLHSLGL